MGVLHRELGFQGIGPGDAGGGQGEGWDAGMGVGMKLSCPAPGNSHSLSRSMDRVGLAGHQSHPFPGFVPKSQKIDGERPSPAKHSPHILIPFLTLSTNCPKSQELDERDQAKHPPHPHPLPALFQPLSRSQGCWDHPTLTQLRDPLEALPVLIPTLDPDPGSGSQSPPAHRESKLERSHYRHH